MNRISKVRALLLSCVMALGVAAPSFADTVAVSGGRCTTDGPYDCLLALSDVVDEQTALQILASKETLQLEEELGLSLHRARIGLVEEENGALLLGIESSTVPLLLVVTDKSLRFLVASLNHRAGVAELVLEDTSGDRFFTGALEEAPEGDAGAFWDIFRGRKNREYLERLWAHVGDGPP